MGKLRPYRSLRVQVSIDTIQAKRRHVLILQHDYRVGIANGRLHQALGVLGAVWSDNFEAGDAAVPRRVVLGMLCGDARGEAVGAAEGDVAGLNAARHVMRLCGRVDDLVNGLHSEVERHELALQAEPRGS